MGAEDIYLDTQEKVILEAWGIENIYTSGSQIEVIFFFSSKGGRVCYWHLVGRDHEFC